MTAAEVRPTRRGFLRNAAAGIATLALSGSGREVRGEDAPDRGVVLWQLPPQTRTQMNCYVLRTADGRIMVIDGGNTGDGPYLKAFLAGLGNHVHYWFISHAHSDHTDAIAAILDDPEELKVDAVYGSLPSREWIARHEPGEEVPFDRLLAALTKAGLTVREHVLGEVMTLDGVRIEILGIKNPEITVNPINNSSVVMRVSDGAKTILFTGDLGVEGGDKLLKSRFRGRLRAEYVQMAHHGQNGVSEEFYQTVRPSVCLWPTPDWLWDNDNGGGKDSGPWQTLVVRDWMEKLGVRTHHVSKDGLSRIE